MQREEDKIMPAPGEKTSDIPTEQLREALRFSLLTLTGIADKVKELQPQRANDDQPANAIPNNLLDPAYKRPWWTALAGAAGVLLGYRVFVKKDKAEK